jgi:hypothetical protein
MRFISEKRGLAKLQYVKDSFAERVQKAFEHRARSCATCETPGACCLDAHFVNVRITRLEAVAIGRRLDELPAERRDAVYSRIDETINIFELDHDSELHAKTYACPLYEKGTGCLVHEYGKPLPCIAHACYERKEDLPPDELLIEREIEAGKLNERVYGKPALLLTIPLAINRFQQKPDRKGGLNESNG